MPRPAPITHRCQCVYDVVQLSTPGEVVVPEDAGDAWVCEDVGVAGAHTVCREGPVLLSAASVVVVNKGHRTAGPPAG